MLLSLSMVLTSPLLKGSIGGALSKWQQISSKSHTLILLLSSAPWPVISRSTFSQPSGSWIPLSNYNLLWTVSLVHGKLGILHYYGSPSITVINFYYYMFICVLFNLWICSAAASKNVIALSGTYDNKHILTITILPGAIDLPFRTPLGSRQKLDHLWETYK